MRMLISGFSLGKELGTRANQRISGYIRIRVDGCKRFEYAACGRENFRIRKKMFAEKKFPHTCGHSLIAILWFSAIFGAVSNRPYAPSFIDPRFTMDHDQNRLFLQANPK